MIKARTTLIASLLLCLASGPVFGKNPTADILRILGPKRVFVTSEAFGSINVFLGRDENGGVPPTGNGAWTATSISGTHQGSDCMHWTSASDTDSGLVGDLGDTDAQWTADSAQPCDIERHLYCFEQ